MRGLIGAVALGVAITLAAPQGAAAQCTTGADCTVVRPDGKGIIGLGLIGAELGLIIPALAGVRDEWWPYLVFPLIGAVGGGIGGWAVERVTGGWGSGEPNNAEVDVVLMAVGMVLIVPTIVGTLALTAYQPPAESSDADEDYEPEDITSEDSVEAVNEGGSTGDEPLPAGAGEGESSVGSPASTDSGSDEFGPTSRTERTRRDRELSEGAARMRAMLAGGRGILRFRLGEPGGAQALLGVPLPYSASSYTAEERARMLLNPATDFIVPVVSATF